MVLERSKKIFKIVPLIGLILIALFLVVFLVAYFGFSKGETWPQDPDFIRIEDIAKIQTALVLYYHNNNSKYFQSPVIPTSLGESMPEVPKDPKSGIYGWLDNTPNDQKYCVWAKLEKRNLYFIASPCGRKEVTRLPITLNECCELSRP